MHIMQLAHRFSQSAEATSLKKISAGWLGEAAGALAAIVLSAVGLAGVLSTTMAALAAVSLGTALLVEGVAFITAFNEWVTKTSNEGQARDWRGVIIGKLLGGLATVAIGILVLFDLTDQALLPVAVFVLGATFLFTSLGSVVPGTQELMGAGAFIAGILALSGFYPLTLMLAALLSLGVVALVNILAHRLGL